jgi:hypothetical protein
LVAGSVYLTCIIERYTSLVKALQFYYFGRVPTLALRVGLYAASPHSLRSLRAFRCYPSRGYVRIHIRTRIKKRSVFTSFSLGGGWVGKPDNPQKNTSFALGMRRACVLARMVQRTEAIA